MTRRFQLLFILSLLLITFAAYWPALHGDFIWDDDRHVSNNHTLLNVKGLEHIWLAPRYLPQWYPLTHTSFWVEYRAYGLNTLGYHIDNVLLHVCNALLLWWFLKLLDIPGAMLAAVIFALHPVEVESVAWISERKNLLATCMSLLSMIVYWRTEQRRGDWLGYIGSLVLFTLAMLSKTVACSTPAVLLVLMWRKRGGVSGSALAPSPGTPGEGGGEGDFARRARFAIRNHPHPNPLPDYRERGSEHSMAARGVQPSDWLRLAPFFAIGIGLSIFTAWTEANHVGARGPEWDIPVISRCLIASRAVWFYLGKLFVPINLTFSYPRWQIDPHQLTPYLYAAALLATAAAHWLLRTRIGRGPFVTLIIFIGVLFPALGFINAYPMRYSFVADHFQYAASIAIIVLFSAGIDRLLRHNPFMLLIGMPLAFLTFFQSQIYTDQRALWTDTMRKNPSSWMATENLAVVDSLSGMPVASLPLFARVAAMKPDHELVHANWGDALFKLRRWSDAIEQYQLALSSPKVDRSIDHEHIGEAFQQLGQVKDAEQEFRDAIQLNASNVAAHFHLAELLAGEGDLAAALAEGNQALLLMPNATDELRETASWLIKLNQSAEAEQRLKKAIEIDPNDVAARLMLGQMELQAKRNDEASRDFSAVLERDPNNDEAKRGLMQSLTQPTTR